MGKKSTLLYLLWRKRFWVESYRIGHLWTIRVKNCITYPSKGHLRSPEVTNRHLPITFDQKEIETWDWCQYVSLGQANRVICNMTHFGHHVTLTWPEVKLWPWPFKVILYMVRRALTRQTQWYQIRCSIFKIKDFIVEKNVLENFEILTPGDRNFDLRQKMSEMISKWFFASFRTLPFVFPYGDQEPRSWGGVQTPPPPPAGGGKSRGPAGRGLTFQGCWLQSWVENAVWQVWPLPHQLCLCHTNILPFYHYWPHQPWLAS